MSRTDSPRLAILGAGPVGLEAGLFAASLGMPFRIYERGKPGENVRRWGHVKMFTPFGMNTSPLGRSALRNDSPRVKLPGDADILTGRDFLANYLEPLAKGSLLEKKVESGVTVVSIGRKGYLKEEMPGRDRRAQHAFRLLLRDGAGKERVEEAEIVLDCTGTYGNGRPLGDGGIPALGEQAARAHISSGLEDLLGEKRDQFADRNVLVVGSGHSAATTICLLASLAEKHPSTWVVWLARRPGTQPIRRVVNDPLRERDQMAARANMLATRGEGHIEFHAAAVVDSVEHQGKDGFLVTARVGGTTRDWTVDRVIANVGYEPDNRLYRELQVHECYTSFGPMKLATALSEHLAVDCLAVPAKGAAALETPEPNFYILGMKSYGRSPNFLLRTGLEQVRDVFTLIRGAAEVRKLEQKLGRV